MPHSVQPLGHAAERLFGGCGDKGLKVPLRCPWTSHFKYLYIECLYSQNNFSEMCFPMRSLILIFHIRICLLVKRLNSLPTRAIVKHFMNTEGFLCKGENENMQGKMCSKAIKKHYVPFNSFHGYSSILFSINISEFFQCYVILLLWLTLHRWL